jgi:hypothetical protein
MSYTGGRQELVMEDTEKEAWIAWRGGLIEAVRDLNARFPAIRESQEWADLKNMLEAGPILRQQHSTRRRGRIALVLLIAAALISRRRNSAG